MGLPQPFHQLAVQLLRAGDQDMVGPAAGVRLHRHRGPGGVQRAGQSNGHHQTLPGPVLFPVHRQGGGGEQTGGIKADLVFLHLHRDVIREDLRHALRQELVQRQLQRFSVKEK